jgi:hypothetical protein
VGERWGTAADRFDRAARTPGGHPLQLGPVAGELRVLARRLLTARGAWTWGGVGGGAGRSGGRDRRLAGRARPRPPGCRGPPRRDGRHRAHPRPPLHGTAQQDAAGGRGERPGTRHTTAAWRVEAVPPPAEQRAHHDPTERDPTDRDPTDRDPTDRDPTDRDPIDRDPTTSDLRAQPGAAGVGVVGFGAGLAANVVGGPVVTDRQDQAVLAVVRLTGDQDVQVTAQHASSTSAAVTVRIGRALLYLNDLATAGHFHKVWFDAAAHARTLPRSGTPRTATWSARCGGCPNPASSPTRPPARRAAWRWSAATHPTPSRSCGSNSAASPSKFATSPPTARVWARSARPTTWPATCSCPPAAHGSTTAR